MKTHFKRIFVFALFFIFSSTVFARNIKIISFNMNGRHTQTSLSQTAKMISTSAAEIVFLQEVYIPRKAPYVLETLAKEISQNTENQWRFIDTRSYVLQEIVYTKNETYKSCPTNQNNAVLYDSSKIQIEDLSEELGFFNFNGKFLFDKNNVQGFFISSTEEKNKKILALNVHLPHNDAEHKIRDLQTLENIYSKYKMKYGVIIAGDFNIYRNELVTKNFDAVDGENSWYYDKNFGLKTTLSTKGTENIVFANDYDHFIYSKKVLVMQKMQRFFSDSNKSKCDALIFGNNIYTNSVDFRKEISDHIPICIEIGNF